MAIIKDENNKEVDLKMIELINEFYNIRFGKDHDPNYREEWIYRYKRDGIDFINNMDTKSKGIFRNTLNRSFFSNL